MNRDFLTTWNLLMYAGAAVAVVVGIVKYLHYQSQKNALKNLKDRYDFMTDKEVKTLQFAMIAGCVAIFLLLNSVFNDEVGDKGGIWFSGRMFLALLVGLMIGLAFYQIIHIQFIGNLERRLDILRNTPRECPYCAEQGKKGQLMRKLSEEEEDDYLTAEQIAEEADTGQHSADFDVWLCGNGDPAGRPHFRVEEYFSYLHAIECPKCNNFTMKIAREEVTHAPTPWLPGQKSRHYRCNICSHRERQILDIPRLVDGAAGRYDDNK